MNIDTINQLCKEGLIGHLGIEFLEYNENFVTARMPIDKNKLQPTGILHGGASLALAETVGSAGSFFIIDPTKFDVLGLQVTANHVSTISSGVLIAKAELIHKGNLTHVWDVKITDEEGKLISAARVTNIIKEKL